MAVDAERARVRSYLVSQAEKLSVEDIWAKVDVAFGELLHSVSGTLTPAQRNFKPGPEEWSILEVLSHITSSNVGTGKSILALASGVPRPEGSSKRIVNVEDDLVALVTANREEVLKTVQDLPASPNLETTAPHSMFGPLNCKAWLLFTRVHNLDHAGQIIKNQQHPDYPR